MRLQLKNYESKFMYPCRDFNHNIRGQKPVCINTIFNPVFFLYRAPTFISTLRNGANARRRDSRLNTASWKIGSWTKSHFAFHHPHLLHHPHPDPPPPDKISLNPTVPPSPSVLSNGRWRFGNRGWIQPFQEADTSFMFPRNGQLLLSVKSDF